MSNMVLIKGWVREARYYSHKRSLLIVLEDVQSKKLLKPVQVSISSFQAMGIAAKSDDSAAWEFFAKELLQRKDPLSLEFDGSKTEEDLI